MGDRIVSVRDRAVHRVRRFWEKPSLAVALPLFSRGCLWNSFVMVGRIATFLATMRSAVPRLCEAMLATDVSVDGLYADAELPSTNFSRAVLATRPATLAVLPVRGVRWSDPGTPRHLLETLGWMGHRPAWLGAVSAEVVRGPA